jgi:hypothetical protein
MNMAKRLSWIEHFCSDQKAAVAVHELTGSTVEILLPKGARYGDERAMYTLDYNDQGTHVILRQVPEHAMNRLLEEFCIKDRHWVPVLLFASVERI